MPSNDESDPSKKRRSSRLKDREAATKALTVAQAKSVSAPKASRKRKSDNISPPANAQGCDEESASTTKPSPASGSDLRRSQRITHHELDRREKSLSQKEKEFKNRSDDLEERIFSLEKKENEASMMMSRMAEREKEAALKQLEEYFLCSLCYEVLAAPYSLNPSNCGHTFCGLCILKWFFSRLHRHCGTWHESVDCPMCRSLLIITPDNIPRLQLTFPFVPNRVAAAAIESLIEKLVQLPLCSQAKIKREEIEGTCGSQSRKKRSGCLRKREKSEEKESEKVPDNTGIIAWREDGHLRAEWLKKDREGKEEMRYLLNRWTTMRPQDFIAMKEKLGV